jgi:proline dehydrogenase
MTPFGNTEVAFITKTDGQLRKAWWLFKAVSFPRLVKAGKALLGLAGALRFPVRWLLKPTIFSHFCGGETLEECAPVVERLAAHNVRSILDYSVEGTESDEDIAAAMDETLRAVRHAAADRNIPFAVFKPTAFAPFEILEKAAAGTLETVEEKAESAKFDERLETLFRAAWEGGEAIMIDAEETWIQSTIDDIVTAMMERYNRQKAIVYNTLQMYRHDRLDFLERALAAAEKGGYFLGIKLVRGAYMEKERARAAELGTPSPIHPDKAATDKAYDDALAFCVRHIDRISLFNGTHNEASCLHLMDLMRRAGLEPADPRIYSSQLYGMSDHISFNMARAGYNVAKYIPYGPVKHVLPYLIRRAEENTAVAGQTGRELRLIQEELERRRSIRGR